MKQKHVERLARYYTEALAKNPKGTIEKNMAWAVEQVPIISAAPELLEALQYLLDVTDIDEPSKFKAFLKVAVQKGSAAVFKAEGRS